MRGSTARCGTSSFTPIIEKLSAANIRISSVAITTSRVCRSATGARAGYVNNTLTAMSKLIPRRGVGAAARRLSNLSFGYGNTLFMLDSNIAADPFS